MAMRKRIRNAALLTTVLTLTGAACGGGGSEMDGTAPGPGRPVSVDLKEWGLATRPGTIGAGSISFRVKNAGTMMHELLVVKTDLAVDKLPVANGVINEEASSIAVMGRVSVHTPGRTGYGSMQLGPGTYVFACNIAGHYQSGMRKAFTVS